MVIYDYKSHNIKEKIPLLQVTLFLTRLSFIMKLFKHIQDAFNIVDNVDNVDFFPLS